MPDGNRKDRNLLGLCWMVVGKILEWTFPFAKRASEQSRVPLFAGLYCRRLFEEDAQTVWLPLYLLWFRPGSSDFVLEGMLTAAAERRVTEKRPQQLAVLGRGI